MCEELRVTEMPQATSVIGHGVRFSGNMVVSGDVSMLPLMERIEAKKVGAGGGRGGRPLV